MASLDYSVHKRRDIVKQQRAFKVLTTFLALQLLTQVTATVLYVSKSRGHDGANSCENISSPCRTLNYTVRKTKGNDVIIMDPANTQKIPYNTCAPWIIRGNLSLISWNGSAIINCSGNWLSFEGNSSTLQLQGLTFLDAFLRVGDISLTINCCSFGSFLQNAAFSYLIHISVNDLPENRRICISSTNILDKNTAGVLNVFNHQSVPVFIEIKNITVANNCLEKANYFFFIQGNANFYFMNSEILNTKFSEKSSEPLLVYFRGCPDTEKSDDRGYSELGKVDSVYAERSQSSVFYENPVISFSIKGLNISGNHGGIFRVFFCSRGNVSIIDTMVRNNTNNWNLGGSVLIDTRANVGRFDVLLTNSSFVSNMNEDAGPMVWLDSTNVITLLVTNCTFSHNYGGAVYVSTLPESKVTIQNSHVHFSKSASHVVSHCGAQICVMFNYQGSRNRQVSFETDRNRQSKNNALVKSNVESGLSGNCGNTTGSLGKSDTVYSNRNGSNILDLNTTNKVAGSGNETFQEVARSLIMDANEALKSNKEGRGLDSESTASLKMNFRNSSSSLEYDKIVEWGFLLDDCEFINNTGSWYSSSAALDVHSAPYVGLGGDSISRVSIRRSIFEGNLAENGTGAIYVAAYVTCNISNCTFQDNAGSMSGAIYFYGESTSSIVIQNCTLDSNSGGYAASTQATGSVRFAKQGTALIQDSRIIQRNLVQTFSNMKNYHSSLTLSSDSFDKIVLSNSVLECQWSPSLEKVIVLEVAGTKNFALRDGTSVGCPWGYNIKRRTISEFEQSIQCDLCAIGSYSIDRGIYRDSRSHSLECLLCPYGGRCTKSLEVLPNFWGYKKQSNPPTILFSRCPFGYCCQAEVGRKSCVPYDKCNVGRYGRLCGTCLPGFTETLFTPFCRQSEKCKDYWFWPIAVIFVLGFTLYVIIEPDISSMLYRSIIWFRSTSPQVTERDTQQGLERIVFFYYQAIDILTVQSSNNIVWDSHFTQFIVGLFNFGVRLNGEGFACPFPGLGPVSKVLFHTVGVFLVLLLIPVIFFIHKAMSKCFSFRQPESGVYLSAFLKSVFLGYAVLAQNSLTLLHCVTVDGVNCLFINCNVECYTWWQKLIGTLVLIYFLPFVFVLFFGTKKLYRKHISLVHFFLACFFPLPFLSYWLLNSRHLGREIIRDTDGRAAIASALYGSYRIPDNVSPGAIYWESVLMGRMLVLILTAVLVKDPFLSSLVLLLLCVINLSSHIYFLPFKRVLDNRVESISLFCLVLIAVFNLPFMAYLSEGVLPAGPMLQVMDVFMWCHVSLVGFLPLICILLFLAAILSQSVRFVIFFTRAFRKALGCFRCFGYHRPLEEIHDSLINAA